MPDRARTTDLLFTAPTGISAILQRSYDAIEQIACEELEASMSIPTGSR